MSVLESLIKEREAWAAAQKANHARNAMLSMLSYLLTGVACYYAYRYHMEISDWVRSALNL